MLLNAADQRDEKNSPSRVNVLLVEQKKRKFKYQGAE